ncbi:hypothetical protein [Altererythrobacter sp. TH136]|uniref:hypothetical protein n=1 Tax=Altererythrobacter sp. TH136 TaxID=2067415 RepID=UPI00143CFE0A|nr:hypothetical protein [Altererythrobacter sp. TH136]
MATRKASSADNTATKQPDSRPAAFIVSGEGTDDEIAERCATHLPGWANLPKQSKQEVVQLMRRFWERANPPSYVLADGEKGKTIGPGNTGPEQVTLTMLRLTDAMASGKQEYLDQRLGDLANYHGKADRHGLTASRLNSDLAFITGGGAKDTVQSTLLVQMAATHDAAMRALANIGQSDMVDHAQLFGNLSTKLLGLYTRQAEVLAKLQREGTQTIKHVHIDNRGGQAVVTATVQTGGMNGKGEQQPYALGPALLGSDPFGDGVPISSDQGEESLSDARGAVPRRAQGK